MRTPDVHEFLAHLPRDRREVVLTLRETVKRIAPGAEETVLWGGLSYHRPRIGGRVKGAVCQINCKRDEVRLEFIHGIRLNDPDRLLIGDAISKRYVFIRTVQDASASAIAGLVREAARLEPGRPSNLPPDLPIRPVAGRTRSARPAPERPGAYGRR